MLLSDLLGLDVRDSDGTPVGTVIDVRLGGRHDTGDGVGPMRLVGFAVSPHTRSSYLGYERTDVTAPAVISAILRWRHRGTFLVAWADVGRIDDHSITLRRGYRRHSARLATPHRHVDV
jgi:sporulation protein YlmC with PRC-barrel domain